MQDLKSMMASRRALLKAASGAVLFGALTKTLLAQAQEQRHFDPKPGDWHTYEVVTRVSLKKTGPSTVWVPLPSIDTDWQRTVSNNWSGNAREMRVGSDSRYGAKYLVAKFDGSAPPVLEVASRVQTRDRAEGGEKRSAPTPLHQAGPARHPV